jgi:integrase
VIPVLGETKLRALKAASIEFLFSDLKRAGDLKPKTLNNYLGTVKKMLNDAVRWGYLTFNPASRVPMIKVVKPQVTTFLPDEVTRLLAYTKGGHPNEYELVMFALNTGCRLGECVALEWTKVDFSTRFAIIDATYDSAEKRIVERTKGKRFRKVPLNPVIVELLRSMVAAGRRDEGRLVFSRINYHYLSQEKFRSILKDAGLDEAIGRRATFHSLRHTFASEFMRSGRSIYELQHVLGHSSVTQTEKYAHFAPSFLAGVTDDVTFGVLTRRIAAADTATMAGAGAR